MIKFFTKFIKNSSMGLISLIFSGLIVCGGAYFYTALRLQDVSQLKEMGEESPLHIYTKDGKFISEFGEKKRLPIALSQVPKKLVQAVLDTEDQRFYEHHGVDFVGLCRAGRAFLSSGRKAQGASTITMQVARYFFLNRQKTFGRKINEILLAFKIDDTFSKEEILELYLNTIYFGSRAYGVAAAAQVYYGKALNDLSLAQMATLAGLPQAPSRDNPITNPKAAKERRNHVLLRMLERGHIDLTEYNTAISAPVVTSYHELQAEVAAPYVAEMVRNSVIAKYGEVVYTNGTKIYTSIDSRVQNFANQALRDGLLAYDQRHGYRGPENHFSDKDHNIWRSKLKNMPQLNSLLPAAVVSCNDSNITALLSNNSLAEINQSNFAWAKPKLRAGDVIRVYKTASNQWRLGQIPKIEGAIAVLDPNTGAILALSGGFSYAHSSYNRAIQAERQPGSSFKPFVYSAALEKGFTLASVINDAPFVFTDPYTGTEWRPQNDNKIFYGPTRLREGLIRSRNLVSIRLLKSIGIPDTVEYLKKFGFSGKEAPRSLSLALGTGIVTPLKMTQGFAVFANGGYQVEPFFINSIYDANNKLLFQAKPVEPTRVITAQNAYLITDTLKGVIREGTAKQALGLKRNDLAGKTGTTNDFVDAWFLGFNSDLVATVWVGFDQPHSTHEHGSQAALPIWMQFMQNALAGRPESTLKQPEGITTVRIDPRTGLLAAADQENAMFEFFTADKVPQDTAPESTQENGSAGEAEIDDLQITDSPLF